MAEMEYEELLRRRDIWESGENHLMSGEDVARFDGFLRMRGYLGAKKC